MSRFAPAALAATGLLLAAVSGAVAAEAPSYKLVKTIDLPGPRGGPGGDIQFDPDTGTVWLCQSANHDVVVIETRGNTVRQVIEGIDNGSGIGFSEHFAFLSDAGNNVAVVVGKRSFEKATELKPSGTAPYGIYFDPKRGALWVTAGGEMTIFKAVGHGGFKRLAWLRLKPNPAKAPPGLGLYVAVKDRLYQPVDDTLDVINPNSRKIEHSWRSGGGARIASVAYDAKSDHLLLATEGAGVIVLDARSGRPLAKIALSGKLGQLALDPVLRRGYVANAAGQLDVVDLDRNALITAAAAEPELHGVTADPLTHFVYLYRDRSNKVDVLLPQ
jgi:DNA-binding beta-propeller fold protein YncE